MLEIKDRILRSSMSTSSAIHTTSGKVHYITNAALSKILIDSQSKLKCKYIVNIAVFISLTNCNEAIHTKYNRRRDVCKCK